jgi:hypothetical protein
MDFVVLDAHPLIDASAVAASIPAAAASSSRRDVPL